MDIHFYSSVSWFERWDWRNADAQGLGGSETSHVELSRRLARRGYAVTSYAPVPDDCPRDGPEGVCWRDIGQADFAQAGLWIVYRDVSRLAEVEKQPDQTFWVIVQDVDVIGLTEQIAVKVERFVALCPQHADYLAKRHPYLRGKLCLGSNGVRMELVRAVEADPPRRNPKRLMYASSPDRGLLTALKVFRRAREQDAELELHAYYGTERWEAAIAKGRKDLAKTRDQLEKEIQQPGVHWHQKVPQPELAREWAKSGIWLYPTTFTETSCITAMDAQCLGAIPITNPIWALRHNVQYGVFIPGDPADDPLVRARYVEAVLRIANSLEDQERIRQQEMPHARRRFNWEREVDRIEGWMLGLPPMACAQYTFQHKHAEGAVLNVGCNDDASEFRQHGAVNLDVKRRDAITGREIPADVIADARDLPASLHHLFDTVILGDILEHMTDDDALQTVQQSRLALRNGGRVILTVPDDSRRPEQQHAIPDWATGREEYAPGISHYHRRNISRGEVLGWLERAGMRPEVVQEIDYTDMLGTGVVARCT